MSEAAAAESAAPSAGTEAESAAPGAGTEAASAGIDAVTSPAAAAAAELAESPGAAAAAELAAVPVESPAAAAAAELAAAPDDASGRVVLVTGGNRGIGLAIARAFRAGGDRVAVTYRKDPVEGFLSVRCDVASLDEVNAAFTEVENKLGPVEILVSNAGVNKDGLLMQMSEDNFTSVVDTNLVGAFRVAKRAVPKMIRARKGRIIFISSVVALSGSGGQTNYAASKAGLIGFARSLAREIASRKVTVNVVAPGFIETDMTAELPEARRSDVLAQIPLGRMAGADEVAAAVTWLASDAAAYVTGALIPVDGGLGMGH